MAIDSNPYPAYLDRAWYQITALTVSSMPIVHSSRRKQFLRMQFERNAGVYQFKIRAWVILDDHYHLLLKSRRGEDIPRFSARIHLSTTHQFNLWDRTDGRNVWQPAQCKWLKTAESFWHSFSTIHLDPLEHGYTQSLKTYRYSSYLYYFHRKGQLWLEKCLKQIEY